MTVYVIISGYYACIIAVASIIDIAPIRFVSLLQF